MGKPATMVDIPALCRALGVHRVTEIDPLDLAEGRRGLEEELKADEPSVVIAKSPCVLQYKIKRPAYYVDSELCTGCKHCLKAGCIALNLVKAGDGAGDGAGASEGGSGDGGDGGASASKKRTRENVKVEILADQCTGCGVCFQLCKFDAIQPPSESELGGKG
jgi:indolepyruvate ferredoxin oxidoreductase alpha subunit